MYDAAWGVVLTRSRFPRGKSCVVFTRCCFRAGGRITSGMISSSSASAARTDMGHRRHRRGARGGHGNFTKTFVILNHRLIVGLRKRSLSQSFRSNKKV
jgi:hypothetical protein